MSVPPVSDNCVDSVHLQTTTQQSVMSALALLFLLLTAYSIHHFKYHPGDLGTSRLLGWTFVALWAILFLEALVGYWRQGDFSRKASLRLFLLWLIPPYRIALSPHPAGRCVWLPGMGWRHADQDCFDLLDRAFSVPMMLIALLILPILAIELFWASQVAAYPTLGQMLDLGTALIWVAFALEFIIMSTVAQKKLVYVVKHWINLAIILLPLLAFLRGFQVTRLLRLGKLGKALKVYRLRGLGLRAWQAVVALEVLERLLHRDPLSRLYHLREQLAEKEREVERLHCRIHEVETQLEQDRKARPPAAPEADSAPPR